MRIVFWLDPKTGFDRNTPELVAKLADGLAHRGYEVELLVEDQFLDDYSVELASRRVYFPETHQQIVADVLVSNSLDKLLRTDLHRVGGRIWLVLEEPRADIIETFENYQLRDVIQVITLLKDVKENLAESGIDVALIQPGVKLDIFKSFSPKDKKSWGITISYFDGKIETLNQVLQGIEMTLSSLNRVKIYLFTHREYHFKSALAIETKLKPSTEERIRAYERSDIIIHIPGKERFSLIPLEGMAVGVPVILIKHPGTKTYAKNRENSLILNRVNPTEIALSILNIIKFGKIREKLKNYATKTVQSFDLNNSIEEFEQLLNKINPVKSTLAEKPDLAKGQELVDIVIVNHNSGVEIKKCLESVREYTSDKPYPFRIIVVDNGSKDDSLVYLKQEKGITLIANQQNMGFAKACNQGILAGKGDYIVILHSDSKVTREWLKPLITEIKKPDVGMVFPRTVPYEQLPIQVQDGFLQDDEVQIGDGDIIDIFPDKDYQYEKDISVDGMVYRPVNAGLDIFNTGCMVIKRGILNQTGLYDEEFHLYCEDLDYSWRVKEKGYQVSFVPRSTVVHCPDLAWERLDEDKRIERDKYLQQSKKYFKTKWGTFSPEPLPRREVDGVILLSLNPWQNRAQRTEAIMDYLTRQGQKTVYIEPYCASASPTVLGQGQHIYTPRGSGTIYHNLLNPGRRVEMVQDLKKYLVDWDIKRPLLWVEAPWWEPIIKHIEHLFLVYTTPEILLGDDMARYQQFKARYGEEEEVILNTAGLIITGSKKRTEELAKHGDRVCYSPGGFYPTDLERFLKGHYTIPDELFYMSGPKVGIVGTFNRFFPRQLLRHVSIDNPDLSFIFIGDITCELKELRDIKNLHFLGNKDWENLLDCLYFFDIMLFPYQDKNFNSYLDPYMINYYLAMGKPVIAFEHRELERFGSMVHRALDEEEFFRLVRETASRLESEKSEERFRQQIQQIRGYSWEQRLDGIYEQILAKVPVSEVPDLKVSEEAEPIEEKESFFTTIIKQIIERYHRLFKSGQG